MFCYVWDRNESSLGFAPCLLAPSSVWREPRRSSRGGRRIAHASLRVGIGMQEASPGLAMATALKLPRIDYSPRNMEQEERMPSMHGVPHAQHIFGRPHGKRTTDVFVNPGRFQAVKTARSQGEVYIHEHDHGSSTASLLSLSTATLHSPRERRALRGEVRGRADAAKRIAQYRSKHAFPVREPYPERVPALPLWKLSDEFRKQSPRRQRFSPGSRPIVLEALGSCRAGPDWD